MDDVIVVRTWAGTRLARFVEELEHHGFTVTVVYRELGGNGLEPDVDVRIVMPVPITHELLQRIPDVSA